MADCEHVRVVALKGEPVCCDDCGVEGIYWHDERDSIEWRRPSYEALMVLYRACRVASALDRIESAYVHTALARCEREAGEER